jgi:hypothetical protein
MKKYTVVVLALAALGAAPAFAQRSASTQAKLAPGQTFTECRHCPEMIVVPAGRFTMGSPAGEPERRENERQHEITLRGTSGKRAYATAAATAPPSTSRCGRASRTASRIPTTRTGVAAIAPSSV